MAAMIRIDKFLASNNIGSRNEVKDIIKRGSVMVDNNIIMSPNYKFDPQISCVVYNGQPIIHNEFEYIILNKPSGIISSTSDTHDITVIDYILKNPDKLIITDANTTLRYNALQKKSLFPYGRLDKDTEGLLILSDNGKLAHELLAPKKHVNKTYFAIVKAPLPQAAISLFEAGIELKDYTCKPSKLEIIDSNNEFVQVYVTISEGHFHQIKKMFLALNSEVIFLKRISFANIYLDDSLETGYFRFLSAKEVELLTSINK